MERSKLLVLLCTLGLVAGCNAGDEDAPEPAPGVEGDTVTVETLDNEFDPAELEVPAGDIEISLDNTGRAPHTFTSEELGVDEEVAAGEQTTFTLSAEPGTYDFVCSLHEALGMVGTLTVTD